MAKAVTKEESVQVEAPAQMTQEQAETIIANHANIAWQSEPAELTEAKNLLNKDKNGK